MNLANELDLGILTVVNLFALRASKKQDLKKAPGDPVGPENDHWICGAVERADMVILAWGAGGSYLGRSAKILTKVLAIQTPYHMGKEKSGDPKHPLRWRKDTGPMLWE